MQHVIRSKYRCDITRYLWSSFRLTCDDDDDDDDIDTTT